MEVGGLNSQYQCSLARRLIYAFLQLQDSLSNRNKVAKVVLQKY